MEEQLSKLNSYSRKKEERKRNPFFSVRTLLEKRENYTAYSTLSVIKLYASKPELNAKKKKKKKKKKNCYGF